MVETNLLRSLPKIKRDVFQRNQSKTLEHIRVAKEFGKQFFDGSRDYGYGGYYYDGRWKPVAQDIINHFSLNKGDKILDVGCAKGFLVKDLFDLGIDSYGIDVSQYAILNSPIEIRDRLLVASAEKLPFTENYFKTIISINTLHNLKRESLISALKEIQRVGLGKSFIQVDSYRDQKGKKDFEKWVLTAEYHDYPENWIKLFKEAGYTGDWYWTILD